MALVCSTEITVTFSANFAKKNLSKVSIELGLRFNNFEQVALYSEG